MYFCGISEDNSQIVLIGCELNEVISLSMILGWVFLLAVSCELDRFTYSCSSCLPNTNLPCRLQSHISRNLTAVKIINGIRFCKMIMYTISSVLFLPQKYCLDNYSFYILQNETAK